MDGAVVKGIENQHEDVKDMSCLWEKCRDAREGQKAIHDAGEEYLPKAKGMSDDDYKSYIKRATFYGAYSRTVDAFIGMILRIPPRVDSTSKFIDDVTGDGDSLYEFVEEMLDSRLVEGFGGILVDHTPIIESVSTVAQAQAAGVRPYLAFYEACDIINWKYINDKLVQVVLEEDRPDTSVEFGNGDEIDQWRVLDIDPNGYYRQRVFVKSTKNQEEYVQVGDDIYPMLNGKKMTEIPMFFIGDPEDQPPLVDVVDLNISHYQTTADLENGCHFTGSPQICISGARTDEGEKLYIGKNAWMFSDPQAKAYYLEFTGQGLGALEKRLEVKEKQMAALGARMLSDTVVAPTATGEAVRSAGEFCILANVANSMSKILTNAVSMMLMWANEQPTTIKLNTDFLPASASAQDILAWMQLWQSGAMSYESLYANLKQGEIILANDTPEAEQAASSSSMGVGLTVPAAPAP